MNYTYIDFYLIVFLSVAYILNHFVWRQFFSDRIFLCSVESAGKWRKSSLFYLYVYLISMLLI